MDHITVYMSVRLTVGSVHSIRPTSTAPVVTVSFTFQVITLTVWFFSILYETTVTITSHFAC